MGLLFALAMALSFLEGLLPVLPMLPPGVKLGLSNIVTMYALLFLGAREGYTIAVLKAGFVLLTRGPVGAALSLAGGLCSVTIMLFLMAPKLGLNRWILSVAGAVAHNLGQLCMAALLLGKAYTFVYLPIMVLTGVGMGLVTGTILKAVTPYFERLNHIMQKRKK